MYEDRTEVVVAAHHLDVAVPEADGQDIVPRGALLLLLLQLLRQLTLLPLLHVELLAVPGEPRDLKAGVELHPGDGVPVDVHHHKAPVHGGNVHLGGGGG